MSCQTFENATVTILKEALASIMKINYTELTTEGF